MDFVIAQMRLMTSKVVSRFIVQTLDVGIKEDVEFATDMNQQRTWNRRAKDFEEAVPILFEAQVFPTLLINIIFEYATL